MHVRKPSKQLLSVIYTAQFIDCFKIICGEAIHIHTSKFENMDENAVIGCSVFTHMSNEMSSITIYLGTEFQMER